MSAFPGRLRRRSARAVIASGLAGIVFAAAEPARGELIEGVLERVNSERFVTGAEPLVRWEALERAALAKASGIADEAASFPGARPAHITSMAELDDLPGHLRAAGFEARQASAHVVIADRPLTVEDLVDGEPALRADLLDPKLRQVGLGVVRQDRLEILVAIVALSKEFDFVSLTDGLDDAEEVRAELLRLTNDARRTRKRRPLRRDRCLERAAQSYADRMLSEGFYGHLSPEGNDVAFRVRAGGCPRAHVGENLARGQTSASQAVEGWLDSPGHRDNLLQPDFRRVGFGMALGRKADEYWIVWVQVLSGD